MCWKSRAILRQAEQKYILGGPPGPVNYYATKKTWKPRFCKKLDGKWDGKIKDEDCLTNWVHGSYKRICYQFDGKSGGKLNDEDKLKILNAFPSYEMKEIGLPLSVQECIEIATTSDLFIGINSGMAHLARSVRVPTLIFRHGNQHKKKIGIWHKTGDHYEGCDGIDDLIFKANLKDYNE